MEIRDTVVAVYGALREENVPVGELSDETVELVEREIKESIFRKSEGVRLALNLLHYVCPNSCRTVLAGDFVGEAAEEVLKCINELSGGDLTVSHVSSNGGMDWEALEDDEDGAAADYVFTVKFRMNGYSEAISLEPDDAQGPQPFFDILRKTVASKHEAFTKNLLATYTLWDVCDMDGALLLCWLPDGAAAKVAAVLASSNR